MEPPRRKRRNTIGIKFTNGIIKDIHYRKVFEDVLLVRNEHILKIQEYNNTHFMFKVGPENYKRICRNYVNQYFTLDEETRILVEDISNFYTEVRVNNIDLEIETEEVLDILSKYGNIHSYYYRTRPNVEYFEDRETGRMSIKMEIKSEIPSTLFIKDTGTLMYIGYRGQTPTCNRCGSKDHKIRYCDKEIGTGSNVIDLELDYDNESEYSEENSTSADVTQPKSVYQTEETSTPEGIKKPSSVSQNEETSTLEGMQKLSSVCQTEDTNTTESTNQVSNTATSQEDVASETHMLTHNGELPDPVPQGSKTNLNKIAHTGEIHINAHTGENSDCNLAKGSGTTSHSTKHTGEEKINNCNTCNFNFATSDDLTEHTKAHEGQVPFKCSDCSYKTNNISDLTNHMQAKKHMLNLINSPQNTTISRSFAETLKKMISPASKNTTPREKYTRSTNRRYSKRDKKRDLPNQ